MPPRGAPLLRLSQEVRSNRKGAFRAPTSAPLRTYFSSPVQSGIHVDKLYRMACFSQVEVAIGSSLDYSGTGLLTSWDQGENTESASSSVDAPVDSWNDVPMPGGGTSPSLLATGFATVSWPAVATEMPLHAMYCYVYRLELTRQSPRS